MKFKNIIKYQSIKTLILLSRFIPLYVIYLLSGIVSHIIVITNKRERNIALAQIQFVFKKNNNESIKIFRKSLQSAAMTIFESFRIPKILGIVKSENDNYKIQSNLKNISCEGLNHLYEIINKGKGAVCLTGHIGNFELMAAFFSMQGIPMTVIGRKANDPVYQKVINDIRSEYGLNMIWREDPNNHKHLIRALKKNHYICALIDQDVALENKFAPFFGLEAAHPIAPVKIAVKFNKPVLMCTCWRRNYNKHQINLEPINWIGIQNEDKEKFILEEYSRILEKHIEKHPEQWVWWHRRWRRRPGVDYIKNPEKLISTKNYIKWIKSSVH